MTDRAKPLLAAVAVTAAGWGVATAMAGVHDTTLASRASGPQGAASDEEASSPSVSGDGRLVAFTSAATNLDPEAVGPTDFVYVRDRRTLRTRVISRAGGSTGAAGLIGLSMTPVISSAGGHVAFVSPHTVPGTGDAHDVFDVFVRDLRRGTTVLASRASGPGGAGGDAVADAPAISADGRFVAFVSEATNLTAGDGDGDADVFVRDLRDATTTLASRATGAAGAKANRPAGVPAIPPTGASWRSHPEPTTSAPMRATASSTCSCATFAGARRRWSAGRVGAQARRGIARRRGRRSRLTGVTSSSPRPRRRSAPPTGIRHWTCTSATCAGAPRGWSAARAAGGEPRPS